MYNIEKLEINASKKDKIDLNPHKEIKIIEIVPKTNKTGCFTNEDFQSFLTKYKSATKQKLIKQQIAMPTE